ncbi:MAG: succinate dehydrogenase assembly factor 2 [Gammaproteobacteria bacterium]|nr:succinate dehydrogenase assembly factor 2 [Gammaproteobacteria bacterium]
MDTSKLAWQCRRGMLELDLMLESFVRHGLPTLTDDEKASFEQLLTYQDQLLFDYLLGDSKPTDGRMMSVINKIKQTAAHST